MSTSSRELGWLGALGVVALAGACGADGVEPSASAGGTGGFTSAGGAGGEPTSVTGTGASNGGSSASGGERPTPSYKPLLTWDFEGGTPGDAVAEVGSNPGDRFTYNAERAKHGTQCGAVDRNMGEPPPECGGGRFYGFKDQLPTGIGQGDTIWIRAWFYFPSEMSWGFVFSTSDDAEMSQCGFSGADGWGWTKFLALSPDTGHLRPYLQIPAGYREVERPTDHDGALYLVNSETGGESLHVGDEVDDALPLDTWVAVQWMLYVHDTDGFSRAWLDDRFLGETEPGSTIEDAAYTHDQWRLGDYWNGFPFTDGAPNRGAFYLDEVIIATDADGYGAPDTTDDGGRAFIAPETRVADFVP